MLTGPDNETLNSRETLNHWLTRFFDPSPSQAALQGRARGFLQRVAREGPGYYMGAGQEGNTRAARYERTRSPGPVLPAPPCPCVRCP